MPFGLKLDLQQIVAIIALIAFLLGFFSGYFFNLSDKFEQAKNWCTEYVNQQCPTPPTEYNTNDSIQHIFDKNSPLPQ